VIYNRYRVVRELGQGGMGRVWLVEDTGAGNRRLALKVISPEVDGVKIEYFKHEFSTMTKLRHPNLIQVYDFGQTDQGNLYFTMEFVEGKGLLEASEDLGNGDLYPIIVQICRALEYIHSRGLIHYDVKPSNIMVKSAGIVVKLMDLGLAAEKNTSSGSRLRGTLPYIAPELAKGVGVDKRADLYSLGVTLYQVVTRRLPFTAESTISLLKQHIEEIPQPPREINGTIPKGLEEIILRLMAKEPSDRYSSANEVIRALNRSTGRRFSTETKRTRESYILSGKFVGREKELGRLKEQFGLRFKTKNRKAYPLVLLGGESGVGKSRLLQEFRYWVQLNRARFLWGRCRERGGLAYGPWVEILSQAVSLVGMGDPLIDRYAPELAVLLPELGRERRIKAKSGLKPEQRKLRLMDSLTRFLLEVTRNRPYVICLEDLHWADGDTVELLGWLSRNAKSSKILICGSYRDDETKGRPLEKVLREDFLLKIGLKRFDQATVSELIGSMLGDGQPPARLAELVMKETDGNPFFVEEVMKSLVEEEKVYRKEGFWRASTEGFGIPSSVAEVVERRINRLDGESIEVLRLISAFDHPVSGDLLAKVGGLSSERLFELGSSLEKRRILVREGVNYDFSHQTTRELLYAQLNPTQRTDLHQRIAQVIEERQPEWIDELAYHFLRGEDRGKAVSYGIKAGERNKRVYANRRAIRFWEESLKLIKGDRKRDKLIDKLCGLYELVGEYEKAIAGYQTLLDSYESDREKAQIHRRLAAVWEKKGDYARAERHCKLGLKSLGPHAGELEEARIYTLLGRIHRQKGEYPQSIRDCLKGMRLLEAKGGYRELAQVYHNLGTTFTDLGKWEKSLGYYEKSVEVRRRIRDLDGLGRTYNNIGILYWHRGRFDEALAYFQKSLEASRKIGDADLMSKSYLNLGIVHLGKSDWESSEEYYRKSLEVSEGIGDRRTAARTYVNLGVTNLYRGNLLASLKYHQSGMKIAKKIGDRSLLGMTYGNLGGIYQALGDPSKAFDYAQRALQLGQRTGDPQWIAMAHTTLGGLYREKGRWDMALENLQKGKELAEELGSTYLTSVFQSLGQLYLELGDQERALRHLQESLQLAIANGSPFEEGNASELLGKLYRAKGEYGKAKEFFARSLEISKELNSQIVICSSLSDMAQLQWELREYEEALKLEEEALGIAQRRKLKPQMAELLLLKGRIEADREWGDGSKALEFLEEALQLAQETGDAERLWQAYYALGRVYQEQKRFEEAFGYYQRCIEIFKASCANIGDEKLQRSYLAERKRQEVIGSIRELKEEIRG